MPRPFIIIVCGGSGSGKTTLVRNLAERLAAEFSVGHLATDDYYKDLSHLPHSERRQRNFDHPDALDLELFLTQLRLLQMGETVEVPRYEFTSHTRVGSQQMEPPDVLLVDGIFALSPDGIETVAAYSIFIDIPDSLRFERRLKRDQEERGRSYEEVVQQYEQSVRPMYEQFIAPTAAKASRQITLDEQMGNDLTNTVFFEVNGLIAAKPSK